MKTWRPLLTKGGTSLHEKLADALEADIASGVLVPGMRLPTHRQLAYATGVGIGSVTRAYTLAIQRGLIEARVGRGSFVVQPDSSAAHGPKASDRIDLAHNLPPTIAAERRFAETLGRLRRRPDLLEHLTYADPAGMAIHRRVGADWLRRSAGFETGDWQNLIVTSGAQEGMSVVLSSIANPGDTVMVESATFFGMRTLGQQYGLNLRPLEMDAQGIVPESLDREAAQGCRILYAMPTLQNPTGRSMSRKRRNEIVRIARSRNLWIVEDDIYGAFASSQKLPPLAVLAPERTFYINGLSKALSPGLRVGFVSAPDQKQFGRLLTTVRARSYAPATLGPLVATEWIESGVADEILAQVKSEIRSRTELARKVLADRLDPATSNECPHVWLPMTELKAQRLTSHAIRAGIDITPPGAPFVDEEMICGVRLCIGGVRKRDQLEWALTTIRDGLSRDMRGEARNVV